MGTLRDFMQREFKDINLYCPFADNKKVINIDLLEACNYYDLKSDYLSNCYKEGKVLFSSLFNKDDNIFFIINRYEEYSLGIKDGRLIYNVSKVFQKKSEKIIKYIRNKRILNGLNLISKEVNDKDIGIKRVYNFYIKCKTKDIKYKKLLKDVIRNEDLKKRRLIDDYYYINIDRKIIYHLCDDVILNLLYNKENLS